MDMIKSITRKLALVAALVAIGATANATPIGDEVTIECNIGCSQSAIVGAGVEFDVFQNGNAFLDVFETGFSFWVPGGPFTGWTNNQDPLVMTLGDIDWVGIPGRIVDIRWRTNFDFFESISFTGNSVTFRIGHGPINNNRLDVRWRVEHAVPEPGTLALLGIGLLGLGFSRRK